MEVSTKKGHGSHGHIIMRYIDMCTIVYTFTSIHIYTKVMSVMSEALRTFFRYVKLILMLVSWLTPKQILPLRLRSWIVAAWRSCGGSYRVLVMWGGSAK